MKLKNTARRTRITKVKNYLATLKHNLISKQIFRQYKKAALLALILTVPLVIYPLTLTLSEKWEFYALDLVRIIGVVQLHPYELLEELDLQKGRSLLTINSLEIEKKLLHFPQIKKVSVQKIYPSTIKITLEEKQVHFLVKTPQKLYAINETGEILFRDNHIVNHNYFVIELTRTLSEEKLATPSALQTFLTHFGALNTDEQTQIKTLFSGIYFGEEIFIFAQNEPVVIKLGETLSVDKLRKAYYAYTYKKQKGLPQSIIDLKLNFVRYTTPS